ncbi:DMT family transporter [Leifsonia poae]|uniref:DMT family transporter n=1 Tax=Leifsonia poae TaxID=110933 RepID=UPI001CBD8380|nr:multidrug efflux SMR transporter [Leifsonia poae]
MPGFHRLTGATAVFGYLFLGIAIATEVVATTFLKFTSGDNPRWWAYAIVIVGYVASFVALSQSLSRGVPLGIAYAIWSAVGVVAIVLISWVFFKESLTWVQIAGIVLVIGGVGLLELGGKHS